MSRKLVSIILALLLSVSFAPISSATLQGHHYSAASKVQTKDVTVYVTKTGKKYHRADCRYLSRSKIAMKLSEAKAEG